MRGETGRRRMGDSGICQPHALLPLMEQHVSAFSKGAIRSTGNWRTGTSRHRTHASGHHIARQGERVLWGGHVDGRRPGQLGLGYS